MQAFNIIDYIHIVDLSLLNYIDYLDVIEDSYEKREDKFLLNLSRKV
jgi:hypothetical protein